MMLIIFSNSEASLSKCLDKYIKKETAFIN